MTPINQNVCGSLNILLWKVSFIVHSGKDSRAWMDDITCSSFIKTCKLVRWCCKGPPVVSQMTRTVAPAIYYPAGMKQPWPEFQSIPFYLIVIHSVNTVARMKLQLCWRGCKALREHRFRKYSNGKPKQQRKNFTLFCSFCSSEHEKELLLSVYIIHFLHISVAEKSTCSQAAHFCFKILTLVIGIFSVGFLS